MTHPLKIAELARSHQKSLKEISRSKSSRKWSLDDLDLSPVLRSHSVIAVFWPQDKVAGAKQSPICVDILRINEHLQFLDEIMMVLAVPTAA